MTQTLSHAREIHVCGSVKCVWFWCSDYTSRRSQSNRHCHCLKAKKFAIGFHKKSSQVHCSSQRDACHHLSGDCHHDEDALDVAKEGYHLRPVFGSTRSAPSLNLVKSWFALCRTCLLGWRFLSFLLQTLRTIPFWFRLLRRSLHVVSSDRFYLGCWVPIPNCFHVFHVFLRCKRMCGFFSKEIVVVCADCCVPSNRELWLCKSDNLDFVPIWSHIPFYLPFSRDVSCVINSFSLSFPMTRAVSWTKNLGRDLTHFDVFHVPHAWDQILRFFSLNGLCAWFLSQVGFQRFSIWVRFELMKQLFDYFFACMVFLFNCRVW